MNTVITHPPAGVECKYVITADVEVLLKISKLDHELAKTFAVTVNPFT